MFLLFEHNRRSTLATQDYIPLGYGYYGNSDGNQLCEATCAVEVGLAVKVVVKVVVK